VKKLDMPFEIGVAGGRLASSAQLPRAASPAAHGLSTPLAPQPARAICFVDTSGTLRKGLRCVPAFPPLPNPLCETGKDYRAISSRRNQQ
jgi:hypothetical protein